MECFLEFFSCFSELLCTPHHLYIYGLAGKSLRDRHDQKKRAKILLNAPGISLGHYQRELEWHREAFSFPQKNFLILIYRSFPILRFGSPVMTAFFFQFGRLAQPHLLHASSTIICPALHQSSHATTGRGPSSMPGIPAQHSPNLGRLKNRR